MLTLRSWTEAQRALLSDASYIGMKAGGDSRIVIVCWRTADARSEQARRAIDLLCHDRIQVAQVVGAPTSTQLFAEADRIIAGVGGVRVYVSGPNPDETELEVTVARGSFEEATKQGTDVLTRLGPRVPVVINEGEEPVPAG